MTITVATGDQLNPIDHPVFFDRSGKRWKRIINSLLAAAFVVSVLGAVVSISILALPLTPFAVIDKTNFRSLILPKSETREEAARRFLARKSARALQKQIESVKHRRKPHTRNPGRPYSAVIGFYVNWESTSFQSFRSHVDDLTCVMPEWLYIPDPKEADGKTFKDRFDLNLKDPEVVKLATNHKLPIIPMLDNAQDGVFHWDRLERLLRDKEYQEALAEDLRDYLVDRHFDGINVDLEPEFPDMPDARLAKAQKLFRDGMPGFIRILKQKFAPAHLLVTQDLPAQNPICFDYETLSDLNDFVVVMLYDQNTASSDPGPIAGQDWVEKVASDLFSKMDSSKVVLGLGNYCRDWPVTYSNADGKFHRIEGMPVAKRQMGSALGIVEDVGTSLQMNEDELNPYFTYVDDHNIDHVVYMLDAVTAYNQIMALKGYQPRGVALWYLGYEDPTLWSFFAQNKLGKPVKLHDLERVIYTGQFNTSAEGEGELTEVTESPRPGLRKLTTNNDGIIDSEAYTQFPSPYIVRHCGRVDKEIALTFDDGPAPVYTHEVLRILKEEHVPATFFVIGSQAQLYQNIVREAWDQGCEIGNHTYTHPHIASVSTVRAELEVNATQRLIESITGHSSRLFRPPYGQGADANASSPEDIALMLKMQSYGYITVGMNIDSEDYKHVKKFYFDSVKNKYIPSFQKIEENVLEQLKLDSKSEKQWLAQGHKEAPWQGSVILMHDGGGNRKQTIEALPIIIHDLKNRGFKFVTISQLLGKGAYARLFPPVTHSQEAIAGIDRTAFEMGFAINRTVHAVFIVAIILGVLRILLTAPLAIRHSRSARKDIGLEDYAPPVTVVVPAYNEEDVIRRTVETLLDSDYHDLRIIVVDDGSTDNTSKVVKEQCSSDPRVTFVSKENGGKASALNVGFAMAETDIVVCMDADTVFAKETVSRLVRHFVDPKVGAVAGNCKVGNRLNPLTIWQSLEYITSQNFDRRAYAALNSVPVIPGAVGAWRKSAVEEAGGYHSNTLAEDTDLTFRIRLLGYHTQADNSALAYTEAPDTIRTLAKQRFRWAYGILQALWKHKRELFRPRYGAFATLVMPAMWLFNVVFQVVAPIVDVAAIVAICTGRFHTVVIYWAVLFVLDLAASYLAFRLDKEHPGQLWWLFWQRFFYRQFMYYIIIKAIISAARGHAVGWGKLQRKATASLPS